MPESDLLSPAFSAATLAIVDNFLAPLALNFMLAAPTEALLYALRSACSFYSAFSLRTVSSHRSASSGNGT